MKLKMLIIGMLSLLVLSGCDDLDAKHEGNVSGLESPRQVKVTDVDFEQVSKAIFSPACITCHKQYADYGSVISSLAAIQKSVKSNRMPKNSGPLSGEQKALLQDWIDGGAPRTIGVTDEEPPVEDVLSPSWASLSNKVFFAKCAICHSPTGEVPWIDLSDRFEIFKQRADLLNFDKPEESYLVEIISDPDEPMPPRDSGIPAVTPEELEVIKEWIRLGLP